MSSPRRVSSNPESVAKPLKPHYANAVKVVGGALLFISGQVALDRDGRLVGEGDLHRQAEQVLENIRLILADHQATMADVVKVTVFVRDIGAFSSLSELRLRYFPSDGPASTIVEVSALAWPEFLIEIEAVAAIPA